MIKPEKQPLLCPGFEHFLQSSQQEGVWREGVQEYPKEENQELEDSTDIAEEISKSVRDVVVLFWESVKRKFMPEKNPFFPRDPMSNW